MFGAAERKGTLFFLQLRRTEQERIKSGTVLCFFSRGVSAYGSWPRHHQHKRKRNKAMKLGGPWGCCNQMIRRGMLIMQLHWNGTSRGCTKERKERQGTGWITVYLASEPSRWEERAMDGYPYREAKHPKGSTKAFSCRLLLVSLFPHEYIFTVSIWWKKKKLSGDSNPRPNALIKSIMQDVQFQEAASARSQKTLHALTEKLDKRPLWVEAKLVPGVVHFANTSLRALSFRKRVRLTQCHCSGDCYFSDPKSQIISMVILPGRQACNRILINYLSTAQLYRLICWQTLQ